MAVVFAFVIGAVAAAALWVLSARAFAAPVFARENFRGRVLPTGVGVVVVVVGLLGTAIVVLASAAGADPSADLVAGLRLATLATLGFGLLGLLDDLGGAGESGGFAGHLRALASGRLTTGALKLFGGAAVAVVVAAGAADHAAGSAGARGASLGRILADGALIALAANLGNLLDRAPARTGKAAVLSLVALVAVVGAPQVLAGAALVVGAGAGLLLPDLRERLMLGDAGANVLGAMLGLAVVMTVSPAARTAVLIVVAALNLASERVSFSRVINATPPLRAFDRLGRLP